MTTENFKTYWYKTYPDSYPINYQLKTIFSNRWFRIHSLLDSKRYAENDDEYKIIKEISSKSFQISSKEENMVI